MRLFSAATVPLALALASAGCATSMSSSSGAEQGGVAVEAPLTNASSEVVVTDTVLAPVAPVAPGQGRRRLSQTITLGQGATEPIYATPRAQAGNGGGGQNVTVNNNVTVVSQPPAYYGGYGGYGYGYGYGSSYGGYGYGGGGAHDARGTRGQPSRSAWAPNGWVGAQRTAAPGRTPGVGGNFAPPPSFGPAPMR